MEGVINIYKFKYKFGYYILKILGSKVEFGGYSAVVANTGGCVEGELTVMAGSGGGGWDGRDGWWY